MKLLKRENGGKITQSINQSINYCTKNTLLQWCVLKSPQRFTFLPSLVESSDVWRCGGRWCLPASRRECWGWQWTRRPSKVALLFPWFDPWWRARRTFWYLPGAHWTARRSAALYRARDAASNIPPHIPGHSHFPPPAKIANQSINQSISWTTAPNTRDE